MALDVWLDSLEERNVDNVSRTASYLELYRYTVENPPDLPWVLMAHVVSRNAGYLMTDLAHRIERNPESAPALENLFLFLERANFLIFHDAWFHVLCHLMKRPDDRKGRAPEFVDSAWRRYESFEQPSPEVEEQLVIDLVTNEQNFIERRVVHNPDFVMGLNLIQMIEATGKEKPMVLPLTDAEIKVGGFQHLEKRIDAGKRIYVEVLGDQQQRRAIYEWALDHPHTGSREVYGGREGPTLREVWPVERARKMLDSIHALPAPDPEWP